jgi:hypothetical protein
MFPLSLSLNLRLRLGLLLADKVPSTSDGPVGRFVPMKLPYDRAPPFAAHGIALVKARFPALGLILDLQNQGGVYETVHGVKRVRLAQMRALA